MGQKPLSTSINENLRDAILRGDRPQVDEWLERGAKMGWRDASGISTLHVAAESGKDGILDYILALHDVDVSITDEDGQTPMHFAARAGNVENMELLKKKGAEIDQAALDGRTPLMLAAHRDNLAAVDWLLLNKAKPNKQDQFERTALHYAVSRRFLKSTIRLVKGGADPHIEDHNHVSAIELAERMNNSVAGEFTVAQFLTALEVEKDMRHGTARSLSAPKTAKFSRKPQQQN